MCQRLIKHCLANTALMLSLCYEIILLVNLYLIIKFLLFLSEQMSRVNITSGSQFQLPLPDESPVTLSFLPDGENYTVPVCEVEKRQLTCARHYCNRTLLQNNSLILRNITLADSGTFIVSEKGTSRTRNVVNVHLCRVGMLKNKTEYSILIFTKSGFCISLNIAVFFLKDLDLGRSLLMDL